MTDITDPDLLFKDFLERAEEGHAGAQFQVALMCKDGIQTDKDEIEAVRWMAEAAKQGHKDALNVLKSWEENVNKRVAAKRAAQGFSGFFCGMAHGVDVQQVEPDQRLLQKLAAAIVDLMPKSEFVEQNRGRAYDGDLVAA